MTSRTKRTLATTLFAVALATGGAVSSHAQEIGNSCATASNLTLNASRFGSINYGGDVDFYRITIPVRGVLSVGTTGVTDTVGTIYDRYCRPLRSNDDGPDGRNFSITGDAAPGIYYISVRHYYSSRTGIFTLRARFDPPPPPPPPPCHPY